VSAAVLSLQVTATRLFSFLIWYHFAFLVLSLAFLGFTAGGLVVTSRGARWSASPHRVLSRAALLGGASTFVAFFALSRLPLEPFVLVSASHFAMFLIAVAVILVPFTCLGVYVCLSLSRWPDKIGVLYAANLAGSGVGCALTVGLLDALGVSASMLASGLLAWTAGLLAMVPSRPRSSQKVLLGAMTIGLVGLTAVATDELNPLVYVRSAKFFPRLAREDVMVRESNSLSSVEVFRDKGGLGAWGVSPLFTKPPPHFIGFSIDGWALTSIFNRAEADVPDGILDYLPAGLPYVVHPPKNVLVIGAGGGVDVLTALHHGAQHVTGVEINPIIIDSVLHRYADFAGHLYQDPRVEIHNAEGRHYLKRDPRKYDVIQLSGVDTFAASQGGAFALHENYLYTVEALHDYLNALSPGGLLTFTRWLYIPPRQTIRLAAMVERAFRERGVPEPEKHLVIFCMQRFSVVLVKNDAFTEADVARIQTEVDRRGFQLLYAPYVRVNPWRSLWGDNPFYELFDEGPESFVAGYPFDIRPTFDDRPFFFEYQRWTRPVGPITESTVFVLFQKENAQLVLLGTLAFTGLASLSMLLVGRLRARQQSLRLGGGAHVYFAALGLGYIAVENVLVQRMILCLGRPAYALTVILCALLVASGLGSAAADRFAWIRERPRVVIGAVVALLVVYASLLRPLLDAVLGFDLVVRVAVVVALIFPLGFAMGVPFPWAIARLVRADARLVPFAWVVNGAASVLGGSITVIVAMAAGFTAVFWMAAGLYACAAIASVAIERGPDGAPSPGT
jgi:spermidine synthase